MLLCLTADDFTHRLRGGGVLGPLRSEWVNMVLKPKEKEQVLSLIIFLLIVTS